MSTSPPLVLSFSATDPTGGAGLQADVLTLASLGCHPLSVATAITAQDTRGVVGVFHLPAEQIEQQARTLLADLPACVCKIGMVGSAAAALAIARVLADYPQMPVVLDPVLASGRGDALTDAAGMAALLEHLLPRATLATPNRIEAQRLTNETEPAACARALIARGCRNVLITGGHDAGAAVVNVLYGAQGEMRRDAWPRLPFEYHGSGCTLAAAIAARLALGDDLASAVHAGQAHTWQALKAAFNPGRGQHLPQRFFTP